ncbi:MAG: thiamine pyrophosphate-dependent dehydrogenase E1 component subunit alpha [Candidatus Paceibacterota bacterium]
MKNQSLEAYKKMVLIRTAEEELVALYLKEKIMSFVHFYVGEEAVAVGVCDALHKDDRVLGNHRSHGHYLAKGGNLDRMILELLGKEGGCANGMGGSMHMIDKSVNFVGSTPILGSITPIASGSAFEQKYEKKKGITVGFIGDGASEEGVVYETLNLAALLRLPFLLVIENNLHSVNTRLHERRGKNHSTEKVATGLDVMYEKADGNDYADVYQKAKKLVDKIKSGQGPAVLECLTYRHMAHSAPIFDENYREEDTLENRSAKDSLKKLRQSLLERGASEKSLARIETEAREKVLASIKSAQAAPYPPKENLYLNLYA